MQDDRQRTAEVQEHLDLRMFSEAAIVELSEN